MKKHDVDAIIACMQKNGYRIAAEVKDVEVKLILVNDNESKWFTVTQEESEFSEDFLFENADKYANAFGSYALSVLVADSDFMMLYLTDGKSIKEKYYLGIVEDYISASNDSDLAYLENLVENKENIPLISEAFNKEYVFIEEALRPMVMLWVLIIVK